MLLETRIPLPYIWRKARTHLLIVFAISSGAALLVEYERPYLPDLPPAIAAFLGTAISLILSFKLNQSYDRWWEARKIWGAIVNDSRSLVRQALSFTSGSDPEVRAIVEKLAHRQIAWCFCLGQSLRGQDWRIRSSEHLDEADLEELGRHANPSLALLQLHAASIADLAERGELSDFQRISMDDTLTRLTDWMGMAERIRNTVFPRTYRAFLTLFIYVFISILSLSLSEVEGYWEIAVTTVIAVPFFLLERTATHMQDPFANRPTDTSVTAIARSIEINLLQLIGVEEVPDPHPDEGFYIM